MLPFTEKTAKAGTAPSKVALPVYEPRTPNSKPRTFKGKAGRFAYASLIRLLEAKHLTLVNAALRNPELRTSNSKPRTANDERSTFIVELPAGAGPPAALESCSFPENSWLT